MDPRRRALAAPQSGGHGDRQQHRQGPDGRRHRAGPAVPGAGATGERQDGDGDAARLRPSRAADDRGHGDAGDAVPQPVRGDRLPHDGAAEGHDRATRPRQAQRRARRRPLGSRHDDGRDRRPARHARGVAADVRRPPGDARADDGDGGVREGRPRPDAARGGHLHGDPVCRRPDARRQRRAAVRADRQGDRRPTRRQLAGIPGSAAPSCPPAAAPRRTASRPAGRSPIWPAAFRTPGSRAPSTAARCSSSAARRRSASPSCRRSTTTRRPSAR